MNDKAKDMVINALNVEVKQLRKDLNELRKVVRSIVVAIIGSYEETEVKNEVEVRADGTGDISATS